MKIQTLIFTICLLFAPPALADAEGDYRKGVTAYNSGNYEKAAEWWRKSAEQGHATAQYNLAWSYEKGKGVLQDYNEAAKWYRKAAEQGDAAAQFALGVSYRRGKGVPQDRKKAVEWWHKAAEQGHAKAQNDLGESYLKGKGVPKHKPTAYMWFLLAEINEDDTLMTRRASHSAVTLEPSLSREERVAAREEVAKMQAKIDKLQTDR